jgi:hypothetical protein
MSELKIKYEDILEAISILGLGDSATIEEIKNTYRELALKYHPDSMEGENDPEAFMKVAWAYRVLMDYISAYKIEFSEKAFIKCFPEEKLRRMFYSDPLWGPGKSRDKKNRNG